ncbi:unknown [Clostridium sp. CAG:122]|nr:MAG: hypothetical protein BHW08_01535 [Clostridium sp. CAG:12237_41]CCZ41297.1 unknown [Clostridium sp. CAG:122]
MLFCSKILNKEAILIREKKTVKFILGFILMAAVLTACGSTKQSRRVHRLCKIFHTMQKSA